MNDQTANDTEPKTSPRWLTCACCGARALGRQWWNRDTGFGLCRDCIPFVSRSGNDELRNCYGVRGVHFDLPEDRHETT